MKTDARCLPCLMKQAHRVSLFLGCDSDQQGKIVQAVAGLIAECDLKRSPPANAEQIYARIAELTGNDDPYLHHKKLSNEAALSHLATLRKEIAASEDPLNLVLRFSIAGNIIDYGAMARFDLNATLQRSRTADLTIDHVSHFRKKLQLYPGGAEILYLADNSGEIVFDALLLEYLANRGHRITVAVKDRPIINDALYEDACFAGIEKFGRIISNGSGCPGTVLERCSNEFVEHFKRADVIISKGQGNFESLSTVDRDIFFLLTVKCSVAAFHLRDITGTAKSVLPGKGEFVVYYSGSVAAGR